MEEKAKKIIDACMQETSKNSIEIFNKVAHKDFVRIHGPEHHVLDGAALLTAFYNAGANIDLQNSLMELMRRGLQMPGATCGMWGVCGAVSSMGAALSIIDGTGPLSTDASWGKHMEFTSKALASLSKVGGPRCCKRDAFLSFQKAVEYVNENYNVKLEYGKIECSFSEKNEQCIKEKCPFYRKTKKKIAFICVHNSCRSQIAEALGKHLASDVFESYSAGTETKAQINQDAVRLMKELYGIDMEQTQYSKLISDIPEPDVAISMGCNVGCPFIGRAFDDNWGLDDPTGKSDEEFICIIKDIESKIVQLMEMINMEKWNEFEFNVSYNGGDIEKINGVVLPKDYIEFMKKHNGGEGDIGSTWLVLYPLEELQDVNADYEVEKFLPNHVIIGSDGGDEFYGIDSKGNYFNVPMMMDENDITFLGTDIELLPDRINALWE